MINTVQEIQKIEEKDLLNRKEFIESTLEYINYYSQNKKTISFSINGEWGSGKSWVIDKLINELFDIQDEGNIDNRYCIFKYNAWNYDYYEEPLLALVMSIKDQIEDENATFIHNAEGRKNWNTIKEVVKDTFFSSLKNVFENAAKVPIIPTTPSSTIITSAVKTIGKVGNATLTVNDELKEKREEEVSEIRELDDFYDLKSLMKDVNEGLSKLSSERTIVIFVDELDRCLPTYAIKVLERIHHICEGINNIQFIFAIDDKQLMNSVKQIFGDEVSIADYLSKFMSFGLKLPEGIFNEQIEDEFNDLYNCFNFIYSNKCSMKEIVSLPLGELPIRIKKQIIEKVKLINGLLQQSKKDLDFVLLQTELFLAYCDYYGINPFNLNYLYDGRKYNFYIDNNEANPYIDKCNIILKKITKNSSYNGIIDNAFHFYVQQGNNNLLFMYFIFSQISQNRYVFNISDTINQDFIHKTISSFWKNYKLMEL